MAADPSADRKSDWLPGQPRPLTLLIACGVVLAAALLVVTGLVADYLRQQTLASSEAGLSRVDAVLVEAGNRSLLGVEAVLSDIASHIRLVDVPRPDSVTRDIGDAATAINLGQKIESAQQIVGLALVGPDGAVVSHAGGWPVSESNIAQRDYFLSLQKNSGLESSVGAPVALRSGGLSVIPVARTSFAPRMAALRGSRSPLSRSAISKTFIARFRWATTVSSR